MPRKIMEYGVLGKQIIEYSNRETEHLIRECMQLALRIGDNPGALEELMWLVLGLYAMNKSSDMALQGQFHRAVEVLNDRYLERKGKGKRE